MPAFPVNPDPPRLPRDLIELRAQLGSGELSQFELFHALLDAVIDLREQVTSLSQQVDRLRFPDNEEY